MDSKHSSVSFFLLILTLFIGCTTEDPKPTASNESKAYKIPTVIDTLKGLGSFERSEDWFSTGQYSLLYIGEYKDTVIINPFLRVWTAPPLLPLTDLDLIEDSIDTLPSDLIAERRKSEADSHYIEWQEDHNFKLWYDGKIEILVDTNSTVKGGIPVTVYNTGKDTIIISYEYMVPITMEALDSLGNWKPVEQMFTFMCGNGIGDIILPPEQLIVTIAPNYQGDYQTKLRLTMGPHHSQSFNGAINYRQFRSKFQEDENYGEEFLNERKIPEPTIEVKRVY